MGLYATEQIVQNRHNHRPHIQQANVTQTTYAQAESRKRPGKSLLSSMQLGQKP